MRYQERPTGFADKSLGFQTLWTVQHAAIFPSALKAVLVNLATFVNSATGLAYPGPSRLAWVCGLSEAHIKRQLLIAKNAGLIEAVAVGGGGIATRYRFINEAVARGFSAAARRPMPPDAIATRITGEPVSPMNPSHGGAGGRIAHETGAVSPMRHEPYNPSNTRVRGVGVAPSGLPSAPSGQAPEIPEQLSCASFEALVSMGKDNPARRAALAAKAFALVGQGHDVERLALQAVESSWSTFAKPPKAQPVGTAPARTTRKAASGIHLGQPNADWNLV